MATGVASALSLALLATAGCMGGWQVKPWTRCEREQGELRRAQEVLERYDLHEEAEKARELQKTRCGPQNPAESRTSSPVATTASRYRCRTAAPGTPDAPEPRSDGDEEDTSSSVPKQGHEGENRNALRFHLSLTVRGRSKKPSRRNVFERNAALRRRKPSACTLRSIASTAADAESGPVGGDRNESLRAWRRCTFQSVSS